MPPLSKISALALALALCTPLAAQDDTVLKEIDLLRKALGTAEPPKAPEPANVLKEIDLLRKALGTAEPPKAPEPAPVKKTAAAKRKITPSHVYQQTENVIAEIEVLRRAMDAEDTPRVPGVQVGKAPLHVYGKSFEVLEKVARMQTKLGMRAVAVAQIPMRKITPGDVYENTTAILTELRRVKAQKGIGQRIKNAPLVGGKTPSNVYENMWRASYLLDGVVGQISPNNVYRNTEYILDELELVSAKLGVEFTSRAPAPEPGRSPEDVNIEGFKNLHKFAMIERKLDLAHLHVPSFPSGRITPSDVYDTTNIMLAELVRLKIKLGIRTPRADRPVPTGKKPPHVRAQMQLIGTNLDRLLTRI